MMNFKVSNQVLLMGAGAGTGVLVPIVLKKYVDPSYPEGIMGLPYSTFIPLVTGGIGLAAGLFTHYLGYFKGFKDFILMYSFSAFVGGFFAYASSVGWWGMPTTRARTYSAGRTTRRTYNGRGSLPSALAAGCPPAQVLGGNCTISGSQQIFRAQPTGAPKSAFSCPPGGLQIIA